VDISTVVDVFTFFAAAVISYTLQKPYVRIVKMFTLGTNAADPTEYKLKNAGAGPALCVVLQDSHGQPIDLDLKLGQIVNHVDALAPGEAINVTLPNRNLPVRIHYENLFGVLFHTELVDAGSRFRMAARKTWPIIHDTPKAIFAALPARWWRKHG
jgi:hypothetical protein